MLKSYIYVDLIAMVNCLYLLHLNLIDRDQHFEWAAKSTDTLAGSTWECIWSPQMHPQALRRMHSNPSASSSRGGGAHASIINCAMTSLIWQPVHCLCSTVPHQAKRRKALDPSVTCGWAGSLNKVSRGTCVENSLACCGNCSSSTERGPAQTKPLLETRMLSRGESSEVD